MSNFPEKTFTCKKLEPFYPNFPALTMPVQLPVSSSFLAGTVLGEVTVSTTQNEKQQIAITGSPTGGTFTLTFNGQTTAAIAYNASAAAVKTALLALSNIEVGDIETTGGALPGTPVVVEFMGQFKNVNVPAMTSTDSLTGGTTPATSLSTTQAGGSVGTFAAYADGNSDGTETARCILKYDCVTDIFGNVYLGQSTSNDVNKKSKYTEAFITGIFKTSDLVGLDANGVTDLKARLAQGSATSGILILS